MKQTPIAVAVAAALFLGTGAALAAGQSGATSSDPSASGSQTSGLDKSFMELDTNVDGMVSKDEASQSKVLSEQWTTADSNADGNVDRAEFSAFESSMSEGGTSGGGASSGGMDSGASSGVTPLPSFSSLDANADGMVSRDEAAADPTIADQFTTADSDQDGAISQSEFSAFEEGAGASGGMSAPEAGETQSTPPGVSPDAGASGTTGGGGMMGEQPSASSPTTALPSFSALDVNSDGKITQDEASASSTLSSSFSAADADQNGSIDQSEFSAFEASGGASGGTSEGAPTCGTMGSPSGGGY